MTSASHQGHGHHDHVQGPAHEHGHGHGNSVSRLGWAFAIVAAYMVVELLAGWKFHSLALISDGVHMLSDAAALGLGAIAAALARRRASVRRTYGYKRVEILAAFANSLSLLWLCLWLAYEAVDRFRHPESVQGAGVFWVALAGLFLNVALLYWLHSGKGERGLNEQGVIWHVIGDTISSVAAVAAGALIVLTGWTLADPLLALVVVVILLFGSGRLLLRTGHILAEGTPEGLNAEAIRADLLAQPQVAAVHDLHLWSLDGRDLYASAHVATRAGDLSESEIARGLTRLLAERHHLGHITLQVGHCDNGGCGAHCGEAHR